MLLSFASCEDNGCIFADDFGGTYITINSNPDAVYGGYPNQSTDWLDTGLKTSGSEIRIAITGQWAPWAMVGSSAASLNSLQSCLSTKNFNPIDGQSNNHGLCAKKVPTNDITDASGQVVSSTLLAGASRVAALNAQNCICYRYELPRGMPNAARDGVSNVDANSPASVLSDPNAATCQPGSLPNGKSAEGDGVFHYTLADRLKDFNPATGKPDEKPSDRQGNICKFEKGMGLYMGIFGSSGHRQPFRLYHLFTQEEQCPITRNAAGDCAQAITGGTIDRTRYIYTTDGIPIYNDMSGNDSTDVDPGDDERHRMRENIKLKIHDSYYQDNYGSYRVEFLSGVYSQDQVLIMEHIVNLVEEVLLGSITNPATGEREGGILRFLFNSIIGNPDFILIVQLMLVLYITFFGVSVLMGLSEISRKELFTKILQIGLIFMFTSNDGWEMYNTFFVKFFKEGMDEVVNMVTMFANTFFLEGETTTSAIRNAQLRSNNPDSMGAKFAYIDLVLRMLFSTAVTKKIWSLFLYDFFGWLYIIAIYAIIFYFLFTMGIVVFVYCITLTKMIIGLALGPIFIVFMLFKQTNEYFKKWITYLAARSLETVILFLLVFIFVVMIDRKFNELLYYSACIQDLDLWLFKLKFMVAKDVNNISTTGQVGGGRSLVDWFLMLTNTFLIVYMTKMIIMQVPDLAGKLISIGGAANQSGSGGSYAASGFSIAEGVMKDAFGGALEGAGKYGGKAAGTVFRGAGELLKNTGVARVAGGAADLVGRGTLRRSIIDSNIDKAIAQADKDGLKGAKREEYVRNQVMNTNYTKQKGQKGVGGVRGWSSSNANTALALNINTKTISDRLDKKLVEEPMKAMLRKRAVELKASALGSTLSQSEVKAQLEKDAAKWGAKNSSLDPSSLREVMNKVMKQHEFTGSRGGWRPRRVNFFDELAKTSYQEASRSSKFGGSDDAKEEYLGQLKDSQFRKLKEKSGDKYEDKFLAESGKTTKGSRGFIRRSHDRQTYNPFKKLRVGGRGKVKDEVSDLERSAMRNALLGDQFAAQEKAIDKKYDGSSPARKEAESIGKIEVRKLEAKIAKEKETLAEKREFYKESLADNIGKVALGIGSEKEQQDLRSKLDDYRDEILNKYDQKETSENRDKMAEGLVSVPLDEKLRIGKKEFSELSLFELDAMREALGAPATAGTGRVTAEANITSGEDEDKERREKEKDKAKEEREKKKKAQNAQEAEIIRLKKLGLELDLEESMRDKKGDAEKALSDAVQEAAAAKKASEEMQARIEGYVSLAGDAVTLGNMRHDLEMMLKDPNISQEQYSRIAMMIGGIQDQELRNRLLESHKDREIASGAEDLLIELKEVVSEELKGVQEKKEEENVVISGHLAADIGLSKVAESFEQYDQANNAYNQIHSENQKQEVIVTDLKVEFGQSIMGALAIGGENTLLKGSSVAIGGESVQNELADPNLLTSAEMSVAQHKYKVKVNKNKMAHLEYQKGNLESEKNKTGDKAAKADIQKQISSIEAEISSLNRENAMENNRAEEASGRVSELKNNRTS